jgi:hypothetical protein
MSPRMPRPAAPGRAHRAANSKELPCTFDYQNSEAVDGDQAGLASNRFRFRTPYVTALGHGAQCLASAISDRLDLAFAMDGPRAFECPKISAAFHEAGHCVVGAVQGERPSKASIWPIAELGREKWIGRTYGIPPWQVDDKTSAEADLQRARSQLAGVVSEMLFDLDFRLASSADEVATAQCIVLTAATKVRRDAGQLWLETLVSVATTLKAKEPVVCAIATELMRRGNVTKRRLAYFLESIGGGHAGI